MRDLELDDAVWRDALAAFRVDEPLDRLEDRIGPYGEIVQELAAEARDGPLMVGFRLASPGKNPRLLTLLTASFLARAGHETLLVDLAADVRWLETALDRDFKEGIVDHLQYGVPVEHCLRPTGLERLTAISGGAYFLAGSPLDDAPGVRATLERLRREHRAVVVALPPPVETADAVGVTALCDVLVTVVEEGTEASPAGSERAVIRLTGDPRAAGDLVRWTRRFLGALPELLSGGSASADPAPARTSPGAGGFDPIVASAEEDRRRTDSSPSDEDRGRRGARIPVAIAAVLAVVAVGFGGWALVRDGDDESSRVDVEPVAPPVELALGGEIAPPGPRPDLVVDPPASTDVPVGAEIDSAGSTAPAPAGRPAPWSVHVGSYLSPESGTRLVERIAETGELAYLVPVDLPGKGQWHRVYVGAYADSTAAAGALMRLLDSDLVEEGAVRSAPMAFGLGTFDDRSEAERARDALRNAGVPAYVVGDGPARVWAGAYETRSAAEPLARRLAGTDHEWMARRR